MSIVANNKFKIFANGALLVLSIFAPILALPFLSRTLGQNAFGLYLSVLSFMGFLVIFCDYGFNISSAKRLALNRDNKKLRSEIILTTSLIKFLLFIIASLFYFVFIFLVPSYSILLDSISPAICLLAALAMQPMWYFIGSEKLVLNSILVAMGRILPLGFLFFLVRDQADFNLAIEIQSTGMLLCCIVSYLYILRQEDIVFSVPKRRIILAYLKKDYLLFFSNILIGVYASFNAVLLGINADFKEVATYAGIERIFKTIESVLTSSGSLFFPSIARKMRVENSNAVRDINDVVKFYIAAGILIIICSVFFGNYLLSLLYGSEFDSDTTALFLFMFIPILGALATAWGNLGLLTLGKNSLVFKILLSGTIANVVIIIILGDNFGAVGGAVAIFVATGIIAAQMKYQLNKHMYRKTTEFNNGN